MTFIDQCLRFLSHELYLFVTGRRNAGNFADILSMVILVMGDEGHVLENVIIQQPESDGPCAVYLEDHRIFIGINRHSDRSSFQTAMHDCQSRYDFKELKRL